MYGYAAHECSFGHGISGVCLVSHYTKRGSYDLYIIYGIRKAQVYENNLLQLYNVSKTSLESPQKQYTIQYV